MKALHYTIYVWHIFLSLSKPFGLWEEKWELPFPDQEKKLFTMCFNNIEETTPEIHCKNDQTYTDTWLISDKW